MLQDNLKAFFSHYFFIKIVFLLLNNLHSYVCRPFLILENLNILKDYLLFTCVEIISLHFKSSQLGYEIFIVLLADPSLDFPTFKTSTEPKDSFSKKNNWWRQIVKNVCLIYWWLKIKKTRMITYIKAKIRKSGCHVNIEKYRKSSSTLVISDYHIKPKIWFRRNWHGEWPREKQKREFYGEKRSGCIILNG